MVVPWFETTTKYISSYIYQWKLLLTGVLWNSCYKYFKKIIKKHPLPSRFLLARTSWQVFSWKIYRKFKKSFFIKHLWNSASMNSLLKMKSIFSLYQRKFQKSLYSSSFPHYVYMLYLPPYFEWRYTMLSNTFSRQRKKEHNTKRASFKIQMFAHKKDFRFRFSGLFSLKMMRE